VRRSVALPFAAAAALWTGTFLVVPASEVGASSPPRTSWNLVHVCTYCHDPHGGPNTANLLDEDVEVLCLTCHGPGGVATAKADTHEGHTCLDCHDKHLYVDHWLGGENLDTVGPEDPLTGLARILTPAGNLLDVVFESRGTDAGEPSLHSFADDDEDGNGVYDGVCEVCHREEGVDNHNFGRTCTVCHDHGDGFED
jgi:predicted CXXCH cytochrome family protein